MLLNVFLSQYFHQIDGNLWQNFISWTWQSHFRSLGKQLAHSFYCLPYLYVQNFMFSIDCLSKQYWYGCCFKCKTNAGKLSTRLQLSPFSNWYFRTHCHMLQNSPSSLELSLFVVGKETNDRITSLFILFSRQTFLIKRAMRSQLMHYLRVVLILFGAGL